MRYVFICSVYCLLTLNLHAQCDDGYMPFDAGVVFELTSYNAKGKAGSVVRHEITEHREDASGFLATVQIQIRDDKGKPASGGVYSITCAEESLLVDMQSMLNPETFAAFGSMEVEITGDALSIPHRLAPGQTLPNAEMQIRASLSGMALITMQLAITNRKVEAKESIKTPAGTFDCIRLSQTTTISGMGSKSYESKTWLARGVGMVRTENYNKKGAMESYTELTTFSK